MSSSSEWQTRTVDELCERVTSGGTPSRTKREFYSGGTIPWVKTGELQDAYITTTEEFITSAAVSASSAKVLPTDTVLMAMYGATVGALGILGVEASCNQASCAMIVNPTIANPRWLFYSLLNDRERIVSRATGAAQQNLSGQTIRGFEYLTPPLREQQAIAEVLGALDDKIAANTALAAKAEEVLRTEVDAEWLSRPDRDAALSDFVALNPPTPHTTDDTPLYIDMKKLPERGWSVDAPDRREPKGGARFLRGDTLLARITPCLENRKTGFVDNIPAGEIAIGSTEFVVLRALPHIAPPIAFLLATESRFRDFAIQNMVGTSGRQRVAASDLARFDMPSPAASWLSGFGERATAIFTHVESLQNENRTLAATRDALLPQLMSGKLRVRDAEQIASEAGA